MKRRSRIRRPRGRFSRRRGGKVQKMWKLLLKNTHNQMFRFQGLFGGPVQAQSCAILPVPGFANNYTSNNTTGPGAINTVATGLPLNTNYPSITIVSTIYDMMNAALNGDTKYTDSVYFHKVSASYELVNMSSAQSWVTVYKCRPRRDVISLNIYPANCLIASNDSELEGQFTGGSKIAITDVGSTPYMNARFTHFYRITRSFKKLVQPGEILNLKPLTFLKKRTLTSENFDWNPNMVLPKGVPFYLVIARGQTAAAQVSAADATAYPTTHFHVTSIMRAKISTIPNNGLMYTIRDPMPTPTNVTVVNPTVPVVGTGGILGVVPDTDD